MADITGRVPDAVPAHWLAYFAVADTDATAARAQELGGDVNVPPMDIPAGRFAVLGDPHGAVFGVVRM
jgi:predicted enzyme related to lactoylglutathione lyase